MYGLVQDGEPFKVFVRRESVGAGVVIRFECKEGMGVLGVRRPGRPEPAPVAAFEEEGVDPAALRAGRFVHVLANGQRQSYALSRLTQEVSTRIPIERWIELQPYTEYGFRYLVAADTDLDKVTASVAVGLPGGKLAEDQITVVSPPRPSGDGATPTPASSDGSRLTDSGTPGSAVRLSPPGVDAMGFPPDPLAGKAYPSMPSLGATTPSSPPSPTFSDTAIAAMSRDQLVQALRGEQARGTALLQRLMELEDVLRKAKSRERDLLELLTRWSA